MKNTMKILGAVMFAATVAGAGAANAQAVRLNLGNVAGLGGVGVTALGGGSLANVNLGGATAVVGAGGGLNANVNLGRFGDLTPTNGPNVPSPGPTLGPDSFFSGSQVLMSGGGGGGGGSSANMNFGDNASANGNVSTQEARQRQRLVERTRKINKRRVVLLRQRV